MAPIHMQNSASQLVAVKMEVPVTPLPMAQPPASMPPKPMRVAPNIERRM